MWQSHSYRYKFVPTQCVTVTTFKIVYFNTYWFIERRLSVTNLSSENNFADVSTEYSSRHQVESERKTYWFILTTVGDYSNQSVVVIPTYDPLPPPV